MPSDRNTPGVVSRFSVSMRWWLALAFAAIAAVTAIAVAEVFTERTKNVLSGRAEDIATGSSVAAARQIAAGLERNDVDRTVDLLAAGRRLSLFVFDHEGRPVTDRGSRGVSFGSDPLDREALSRALAGRRFVDHDDDDRRIVVGLPLHTRGASALVTVAFRKDLVAEAGLFRNEILRAAIVAVLVGALVGLLVAVLVASRLRRISSAAAAIEAGRFDTELRPGRLGDEVGALAVTIDRMRGKLRESFKALESERDRLRTLFEQLQEGVVAFNASLEVELVNKAARRLLSEAPLAEGHPLPELWPDVQLRSLASGLFETGAGMCQARVSPDPDRIYAIVGIPAGAGGSLALLVISDVSARARRERAEREFVANASHELRTPLTAIANAVEALQLGAKDETEERERFLDLIDRQTKRLDRLVRALLGLARAQTRQEALQLGTIRLKPVLEDALVGIELGKDVELEVSCPEHLAVLAERSLLEQVIANLAANAVKHTQRGKIRLEARLLEPDSAEIAVVDDGAGIPRADQERVFDRFYQTRANERGDGFGLGLAIVREAVQALGGAIQIDSAPGRGTDVRLTLPAGGGAE